MNSFVADVGVEVVGLNYTFVIQRLEQPILIFQKIHAFLANSFENLNHI